MFNKTQAIKVISHLQHNYVMQLPLQQQICNHNKLISRLEVHATYTPHTPQNKIFMAFSSTTSSMLIEQQPILLFCQSHPSYHIHCLLLPYIRLSKIPSQHIFTLEMATAMFAKMLNNFQHSAWLIPKFSNLPLNSSCKTTAHKHEVD